MEFSNINLWFAKDKNNSIITIDKINEENKHDIYTCPICGSELIARTGEIKVHHFAHKDKSKCSSETMIHWWVKHKLIDIGDKFSIKVDKDNIKEFICKEISIEKEYDTDFGKYKPDITIITDTDEIIYFEIEYTNKKKVEEYLDRWLCLDNIVVEVSVKDMINNNVANLKTIFYQGLVYQNVSSSIISTLKSKIDKSENEFNNKYLHKILWLFDEIRETNFNVQEEKNYIFEILDLAIDNEVINKQTLEYILKSKCIDIKSDFINYRISKIKNICNKHISETNSVIRKYRDNEYFSVNESTYYKIPVINIEFKEKWYDKKNKVKTINYYDLYYNINKFLLSIKEDKNNTLDQHLEIEEKRNECVNSIKEIEDEINIYLSNINNNYKISGYNGMISGTGTGRGYDICKNLFHISFRVEPIVWIDLKELDIPKDDKTNFIVGYIKNEFDKYRSNLKMISKDDVFEIENICNFIDSRLTNVAVDCFKLYKSEDKTELTILTDRATNKNRITIIFNDNKVVVNNEIIIPDIHENTLEENKLKVMNSVSNLLRKIKYATK